MSARPWQPERKDWVKILRAVLSVGFWTGRSTTHPGYTWYLERVDEAVRRAMQSSGHERVDIVAHSAGGWLARAYMGGALDGAVNGGHGILSSNGTLDPKVRRLVTLGAPHIEPPAGANDATRGALKWVNNQWPGAHYGDGAGVSYTCVTGRTVRGTGGVKAQGTLAGYASNSYRVGSVQVEPNPG